MDGWKKISDETFIKSLLVTSWQGVVAEHLAKFFLGFKDLEIFQAKFFFHLKMAQFSDKTIIKSLLVLVDRLTKSDMVSSFKLSK